MTNKVIPVVVLNDIAETLPKLSALRAGGIGIAEITYRTACAADAISLAVKEFPDMLIGAGTVINKAQCEDAISRGAKFIVSPGLSAEVAVICKKNNIPYYPGCVTPTEIIKAIDLGLNIIKFFPAQVYGGLKAIKALAAPFPQIKFIPTGGVDNSNLAEYLSYDKIFAVGGSWMMKGDIAAVSKETVKIIKESEGI